MTNLVPSIMPFTYGLDLESPKLLAKPGSMLSCLNYEVLERQGYARISGFVPYDGNPTLKDFEGNKYWSRKVFISGPPFPKYPAQLSEQFILDTNGDIIGWCFSIDIAAIDEPAIMRFISFLGDPNIVGELADELETVTADVEAEISEVTITQNELRLLETAIRNLVPDNTEESICVGLHWHRDHLYGAWPLVCIRYACEDTVTVTSGSTLTSTLTDFLPLVLLDKITTSDTVDEGYLICLQTGQGEYEAGSTFTETLGGGVSSASTIYHQPNSLKGMNSFAAHLWKATRQNPYVTAEFANGGGWNPLSFTYSVRAQIDLTGTEYELKAVKRGYKPDEATKLRFNSTHETILEDFYIVEGDLYESGGARVILQVATADETNLVPFEAALASEWQVDIFDDPSWVDIGDTVSRPRLVFLAGASEGVGEILYYDTVDTTSTPDTVEENYLHGLSYSPSRYSWKSANFFATEASDAFYGCDGAGRGFAVTPFTLPGSDYSGTYSWIYTQPDENKDRPRHVENHNQHLLLGFGPGSVQSSVVGLPTNFQGVEGASEIGVGDRITGLLVLNGTTTAIFCESSIWGLQGQNIDNFNTQIISPNVGAIEYTVVNCGRPVFLNQYGISTLEQSAAYGDFESSSVSQIVAPWLVPRCKLPYPGADYSEGVVGAFPVRKKNQYRIFFNDGECLTATFIPDGIAFSRQVYQLPVEQDVDEKLQRIIPLAWTSQVDNTGRERIIVSHYDKRVTSVPVDTGNTGGGGS